MLLEYVDGKTLDEIEAPEMGQLILMFCQVASALAHMHRRGVFHGDLKPSNIMLSKNGQVKLIDFGTAWIRNRDKNRAGGTPQYVAPEQAIEKTIDAKTDIYNFGHALPHVHRPLRQPRSAESRRRGRKKARTAVED